MMDLDEDDALRLIELFRQKAADRRLEAQIRVIEFDEEHKRRHERKLRNDEEKRKLEEVLATTAQLAAFNEHLDEYDTATVHALMDNQHALDLIFKQREELEASAYRLPDGRMIFKTEDGRRVFDQHGAELGPETIHPNAIPGSAPSWESRQNIEAAADRLIHERDQLHDYQKRVDEAREQVGKGNVTADALAKMDADLRQAMPNAVKAQLPGSAAERDITSLRGAPAAMPEASKARLSAYAPAAP